MAITPGTTNFLQFNPNASNQETDAQWNADTSRSGGLQTDQIVTSPMLNKALFQSSTFTTAFGEMMATKGFSTADTNLTTLASVLANVLTTADQKAPLMSVAFSSSMTFDASQANGFEVQVPASSTGYTFSLINTTPGQIITFVFVITGTQTGHSAVLTYPANVLGGTPLTTTLDIVNLQSFFVTADGNARALTMLGNN